MARPLQIRISKRLFFQLQELAQLRGHHTRERVRLDLLLLTINDDLDLTTGGHEGVANDRGKIVVGLTTGITLDHDLVMRRHAHINAHMIAVLRVLMRRILLDENAAAGDMVARHLQLGDLFRDNSLDLGLVLHILHDKF